MEFADHFSSIAARYAEYRPHYPPSLAAALAERCARRELAWEVGCGNGQLSVELGEHFARVIATDPSEEQLAAAVPHARVEYRRARAEASGLPDACADLAVAAQAAHWFEWASWLAEIERVTQPGALVALVAYGLLYVDGAAHESILRYYHALGSYWPPERAHIMSGYRDLQLPWPAVEAPAVDMIERWTRDELLGYVATWSATVKLVRAEGGARYDALRAEVARDWPDGEVREVRWPLVLKLARRM